MSIASKINALIAAMAVIAGVLLTLFVGQRDFSYQRDALMLQASSLVGSQPQLQLTFYFRDPSEIGKTLDELLALSPAVKHAVMYDSEGAVVGKRQQGWAINERVPTLSNLREGLSPLDTGVITLGEGSTPANLDLLRKVSLGERSISLSLPVISVVNPIDRNLNRADFAAAMVNPELVRSAYVIGYIDIGISSTVLWSLTLPSIALSAGISLGIVFVFWFLARLTTRRITAPLNKLVRVADDIASGRQTETLRIRGSGEIRQIAEVFNGIITGLHQYTRKMDADKKILSLKVNERNEQLTEKAARLEQAVQTVDETRGKLRQMAYFDSLTSLPNRKLFTEQLTLLLRLASRNKQKVGLLLVDIDNFKRINDSLGARAGDMLLRSVSDRLSQHVRESDVLHRRADYESSVMDLSRMGGDEFTVVLNQVEDVEAAQTVAARLADALSRPYSIEGQEVIITCSIGIALTPEHATDVEGLLRAADTAMINAKQRGRNRNLVYDTSMESANRERLQLENDLRKAVTRGQLVLHYQPQVHGQTGRVEGVEALVRWNHPDHGLVPPFKWIPVAEELGLIEEIGAWVLERACLDLQDIRRSGLELPEVAVNVSALQFNEKFVQTVSAALVDSELPPASLKLELTEGIMINNQDAAVALVRQLKDLGVRLSIDDFGTGYSSLSYLTRFPLDSLKIDRSFVLNLFEDEQGAELVRVIIAMANSLRLSIVVEGVERYEELEWFREQDVHTIQGFLFSQPVPVERLKQILGPDHFPRQVSLLQQQAGLVVGQLEKA
jgi:diguanylate cyclase (GGDEF)-like protein